MIQYTRKSLAKKLGIGSEALRYYEKMGVIPIPERAANGYRIYTEEDLNSINHTITAKKYGFSLKEIKALFEMTQKKDFNRDKIKPFLLNKIQDIDNQINELNDLKKLLHQLIQSY
jgi:MerR family copper efflux transcriptional regulator